MQKELSVGGKSLRKQHKELRKLLTSGSTQVFYANADGAKKELDKLTEADESLSSDVFFRSQPPTVSIEPKQPVAKVKPVLKKPQKKTRAK